MTPLGVGIFIAVMGALFVVVVIATLMVGGGRRG